MNSSRIVSRVVRRFAPQARKAHDVHHHDKYALKAAKCYLEGHAPYRDVPDVVFPINTDNPYTLWLKFFVYFGSGFWLPFASYHYARVGSLR